MRILGQGSFACVKLALNRKTKKRVAIKIYPKYKLKDPEKK